MFLLKNDGPAQKSLVKGTVTKPLQRNVLIVAETVLKYAPLFLQLEFIYLIFLGKAFMVWRGSEEIMFDCFMEESRN